MKRSVIVSIIIVALLIIGGVIYFGLKNFLPAQPSSNSRSLVPEKSPQVKISGFAFDPSTVAIRVGSTVTWLNTDPVGHTITGDNLNSDLLATGQTYRQTFNQAGTFNYYCSIHPFMKGQVIVVP